MNAWSPILRALFLAVLAVAGSSCDPTQGKHSIHVCGRFYKGGKEIQVKELAQHLNFTMDFSDNGSNHKGSVEAATGTYGTSDNCATMFNIYPENGKVCPRGPAGSEGCFVQSKSMTIHKISALTTSPSSPGIQLRGVVGSIDVEHSSFGRLGEGDEDAWIHVDFDLDHPTVAQDYDVQLALLMIKFLNSPNKKGVGKPSEAVAEKLKKTVNGSESGGERKTNHSSEDTSSARRAI